MNNDRRTLTQKLLSFVLLHPGLTAWEINKELGRRNHESGTVAAILKRCADEGQYVQRRKSAGYRRGYEYFGVVKEKPSHD